MFVFTENLVPETKQKVPVSATTSEWTQTVTQAIEMSIQDDGWATLAAVGAHVRQLDPAFDPRSYGEKRLAPLVRSRPELFQVRESKTKGGQSVVDVKMKS